MTDREFEHAFGRKRGEPGPLSPIARYNVAKMAAKLFVQRRGLDYDLVDFMTSDATIVALSTKTDETRPAAMQVEYVYRACRWELRRLLRMKKHNPYVEQFRRNPDSDGFIIRNAPVRDFVDAIVDAEVYDRLLELVRSVATEKDMQAILGEYDCTPHTASARRANFVKRLYEKTPEVVQQLRELCSDPSRVPETRPVKHRPQRVRIEELKELMRQKPGASTKYYAQKLNVEPQQINRYLRTMKGTKQ